MSEEEKKRVLSQYNKTPQEDKWILSTGTIVDDQMKQLAHEAVYEHPVHSMIMDPNDSIWKKYFTAAELNEIKSHRLMPLAKIPQELQDYMDSYDKEWKSAIDFYNYADSQKHDPITEFDKKWVRESIIRVTELFLCDKILSMNDCSESDLLHKLWPFVYRIFRNRHIKAMLGERCSVAVARGRNEDRTLEAIERRSRKTMGAKVDILFKFGNDELGPCEVGKDKIIVADDKYMDDGLVKLPKTLRDMLAALIEKNPAQVNHLASVGFLMMGLNMELISMDVPVGHTITRVSKTPKLEFPSSVHNIALDFIPLLEATWKGREAMKTTVDTLSNRKKKAIEFTTTSTDKSIMLPYSFVRSSST